MVGSSLTPRRRNRQGLPSPMYRRSIIASVGVLMALAASTLGCPTVTTSTSTVDGGPDVSLPPAEACPNSEIMGDAGAEAGTPALAGLAVSMGADASSGLSPAFSPAIYDYYVMCAAGTNDLAVGVKIAKSGTASLAIETPGGDVQPAGSTGSEETFRPQIQEGQAVVVTVSVGSATQDYWVRCLPHDMSPMQWSTYGDTCARSAGYYLVGDEAIVPGYSAYAIVLDRNGVPVWYHRAPQVPPYESSTGFFDVDSVEDGTISFLPWPSIMLTGPFQLFQLSNGTTTAVDAPGWALDAHELQPAGNGHYYLFTDQVETGDLTGFDVPEDDGGVQSYGAGSSYISCDILEVDSLGNLVWRWVSHDHLDPVKDNTHPGLDPAPSGQMVPDPYHCNAIDVDPANGNLLVSARHEDSVFYIDRATSKILWKMGGQNYTKDGATYIPVTNTFHLQHDARLVSGWSTCGGQVSLFDDQSYMTNPARGIVYDVETGLADGGKSCGTPRASVAWQRSGAVSSTAMGSFRISSDGSRVIGWGTRSEQKGLVFTEVDVNGDALVELTFTNQSESYRAVKVPFGALNIASLRRTAGL
jgi:hypothetical protein